MQYSLYVSVVLVNSNLDILLCKRKYANNNFFWSIPIKKIEDNECIKDAINNCLYINTNLIPLSYTSDGYIENVSENSKEIVLYFICEEFNNFENLKSNYNDDNIVEFKWFSLTDIPPDIDSNTNKYLNDIDYYT